MMTRSREHVGIIVVRCDQCGRSTYKADVLTFWAARDETRLAGWSWSHRSGRWQAWCPSCIAGTAA